MHRPVGTAAVRLSLWMLVMASLAMGLAQPVQAGTEAAPEIADPANDQAVGGVVPISTQPPGGVTSVGLNADLLFGWIDSDTETSITLNLRIQGTGAPTSSSATQYTFHLEHAGTGYDAGAKVAIASPAGNGAVTATGVTESATVEAGLIKMVVPKANIGSPAGGAVLTNLFATASGRSADLAGTVSDRAPNAGAGSDYTIAGGGGGGNGTCDNCTADDTDGDGLNDTWETEHFGNITAQNATGDPDGDNLTNGQEQELGTDPTNPDTDGDGVNDDVDPFPLDRTRGGSNSNSTSTSTSRSSSTSTTSGSRSLTTTTTGTGGADAAPGTCADSDTSDAVDCLTSDVGYLGMSAGGFLAVLILCIVALATRWSL